MLFIFLPFLLCFELSNETLMSLPVNALTYRAVMNFLPARKLPVGKPETIASMANKNEKNNSIHAH